MSEETRDCIYILLDHKGKKWRGTRYEIWGEHDVGWRNREAMYGNGRGTGPNPHAPQWHRICKVEEALDAYYRERERKESTPASCGSPER